MIVPVYLVKMLSGNEPKIYTCTVQTGNFSWCKTTENTVGKVCASELTSDAKKAVIFNAVQGYRCGLTHYIGNVMWECVRY